MSPLNVQSTNDWSDLVTQLTTHNLSPSEDLFTNFKNDSNNTTSHSIFLQTKFAQALAGIFAFSAILITCWQVLSE